jgi:hypothetical protein
MQRTTQVTCILFSNTIIANEYVESRDIQWDEPRQYRKLSLEATRGEAVKHTPPPTQDSASTNRFAALISNDEGKDDEEDDDSGDDGDIRAVARQSASSSWNGAAAAGTAARSTKMQRELRRLAGHNNSPAHDNSNARAGILGRTRQVTKSVQFAVVNNVAAPKDDALLYKIQPTIGKPWKDQNPSIGGTA